MVKVAKDNSGTVFKAVEALLKSRTVVGVPAGAAPQRSLDGKHEVPMALVAYVQEFGSPEKNIPARPFMSMGMAAVKGEITAQLVQGARAAFAGDLGAADRTFHAVGLIAQSSIKATILAGDFVPLSERTLEARARRRNPDSGKLSKAATSKNARLEMKRRADGLSASTAFARPLYDKGDLYRAITYAVRVRG